MFGVGVDGWFTLLVLAIMFVALVRELLGTDIVICAALIALWARGIITTDEATSGFNNPQVLTIGMLFIVSAAMRETGALTLATSFMFGRNLDRKRVLARLIVPTAAMSSFLNNTPDCGDADTVDAGLVIETWQVAIALSDSAFLCGDSRRHLYSDRYVDEPGGVGPA